MKGDLVNIIPGDFNGDGKTDFIRQEKGAMDDDDIRTADIYLSNGNGTFTQQPLTDWQIMKGDFVNIVSSANFNLSWGELPSPEPTQPTPEPTQPTPEPTQPILSREEFLSSWQKLPEYTSDNPFLDYNAKNCTWYAYGRMKRLGYSSTALDTMLGHAGTWNDTAGNGATVSSIPQAPCIAVWEPWVGGAEDKGHVAVVERINYNSDGSIESILISESNWLEQQYYPRTISLKDRNGQKNSHWPSEFILVPKA
jgi:surface antigen